MRHSRNEAPVLFDDSYNPQIGKATQVADGGDVTIINCGILLSRCLEAAEQLRKAGIESRIIDMFTLKPLDTEAVVAAATETGAIVTVEEHSIIGGLGAAVAETVCENLPVPVVRVGLRDQFAETGPYEDLLNNYGMAVQDIVEAAKKSIAAKS